ncbi:hypothetical protein TWF506_004431 [Arthrobotrys conoides]|uniref:FAD-binding PCMH-type domain-containing protein n=1 Tax=Arthrobotrys conoides TaxID=74498 RepID=A0AAN8NAB1_9PEZI
MSQPIELLYHERGTEEYERSVATSNLLYRFSRPERVAQPKTIAEVEQVIQEAIRKNLRITIKNGGHSFAGSSTASEGISLDLVKLNTAELSLDLATVTLGGGAKWAHAYKTLINGGHDGFAINGGRCPTVGVSGFILGGGLGPFTRSFGMGSDTLKEAKIVTAKKGIVVVKDTDKWETDKGKLFWALRGAGGGNFGVVVETKLEVKKLRSDTVVAGRYNWFPKPETLASPKPEMGQADNRFLKFMNAIYKYQWDDEMTIDTSWLCDLGIRQASTGLGIRFLTYFNGGDTEFEKAIKSFSDQYSQLLGGKEDPMAQLIRRSLPEASTRFLHETLVAQWSEETKKAFPDNKTYSRYSSFVFDNKESEIEKITLLIQGQMDSFRKKFTGEKVFLQVTWIHSGGQARRQDKSTSAFYWRDATYHTYIMVEWEDKWMERDMRAFLQAFKDELRPYSLEQKASFINFPDEALDSGPHGTAYYGENYSKLQVVKEIWDPDNFFNWSQGVQLPLSPDSNKNPSTKEPSQPKGEEDLTDKIAGGQWKQMTEQWKNDWKEGKHFQFDDPLATLMGFAGVDIGIQS